MNFPKKQAQRLMPLYLVEYSEKLFENHPDPSESWGGSHLTAGYGIDITNDVISVDPTIIPSLEGYATQEWVQSQGYSTFSGDYDDLANKPTLATTSETLTFTYADNTTGTLTVITSVTLE